MMQNRSLLIIALAASLGPALAACGSDQDYAAAHCLRQLPAGAADAVVRDCRTDYLAYLEQQRRIRFGAGSAF